MPNRRGENFRFLAENSADMVCRVGFDLVMHYASPSCERILGWKPEEMVGKGPEVFVHPQDLPIVAAAHQKLLKFGVDPTPTSLRMRNKNGGYTWMQVNACLGPQNATDKGADIVLVMRADYAAHNEELVFSRAFSTVPLPMAILAEGSFRILGINSAFSQMTGYGLDELKGKKMAEVRLLDAPTCQSLEEKRLSATQLQNIEVCLQTKDGTGLECYLSAVETTLGTEGYLLAIFLNAHGQNRSEADLKKAIESVMQEASWFSRAVVEKLAQLRFPRPSASNWASLVDLTGREREILGLVCQGLTDPEISDFLKLSRNTVRNHLAAIYSKINVHRRAAAVVWARQRGIYGYEKPRGKLEESSG